MNRKLSLAYSPCPNDTFIFYALSSNLIRIEGCEITTHLLDVETLNKCALENKFDITKLSFHAMLKAEKDYRLLKAGAAVSYGSGPLLVSKRPLNKADLNTSIVAVPGELTSAHFLLQVFYPELKRKIFTTYDKIFKLILEEKCDAGVLIHESRFVYEKEGLIKLSDLGELWEKETNLPVPLGCIAVKKALPDKLAAQIETAVRKSLEFSKADPSGPRDFIKEHSIEKDDAVIDKHIKAFVNDLSLDLGEEGLRAYEAMREMAFARGIIK